MGGVRQEEGDTGYWDNIDRDGMGVRNDNISVSIFAQRPWDYARRVTNNNHGRGKDQAAILWCVNYGGKHQAKF